MAMGDFVCRDAIVPALAATTREGVIREMVESLAALGYFAREGEREEIVRAIQRREQLGSTGIGRGIAIPHTKHASVDRMLGTVALSRTGVAFDSIDGEPVYVFVLLVSPQDRPGDHLRALENVVRTMRDDNFVRALRQCSTRDEIWRLLTAEHPPGWPQ
jgi:PTS system fructose-specific IIA component/PTS system nitrogen regulatory IIA component